MERVFSASRPEVQIKHVAGKIVVSQSPDEKTYLTISSDNPEKVSVEQRGDRIVVSQEQRRRLRKIIVSDLDIHLRAPSNSSIDIATVTGSVVLNGSYAAVSTKSVSGDVTGSIGASSIEAKTVAGDLEFALSSPGEVAVKSVSGDITIALASGLGIDIDAKSLSGNVKSEIELDGDISGNSMVSCKATSVSGDIRLERAR